ncbi:hypothetical protein ALPO108162_05480 [Alicyclobacillus pomorum]
MCNTISSHRVKCRTIRGKSVDLKATVKIMFHDSLIPEFVQWKDTNGDDFSWWDYVNLRADLQTALGFAKFFYPDVLEVEGYFLLKDKYKPEIFEEWKADRKHGKQSVEKMMNLYEVNDFFHINHRDDETDEQVHGLGEALKLFWTLSFRHRFPGRKIVVSVFEEDDGCLFITVYEET